MPGISLCFPHVSNPWNDAALRLKKHLLEQNTRYDYELFYVHCNDRNLVYPVWDWTMKHAKYDIVVWDNSDILYAKDWDVAIHEFMDYADWLSLRVVECGAIGVAPTNIDKDFGRTPQSFQRKAFEDWCKQHRQAQASDFEPDAWSWYSPSAFKREWFKSTGGFDLTLPPFPYPVDSAFKDRIIRESKEPVRFGRCASYAYHLQFAKENATGEYGRA